MASFPAEFQVDLASSEATACALREVTVCWNQAYEALCRGDLEAVADLMDIAEEQLAATRATSEPDCQAIATLRSDAAAARGRLEHGMRAGLEGLAAELAQTRRGARTLHGYRQVGGTSQPTLDGSA